MDRKFNKYLILILTVLIADLVSEFIMHKLSYSKDAHHPYYSTMIGMLVTVAVFAPLLAIMDAIVGNLADAYVKKTKKAAGGSVQGFVIATIVGLGILYCLYLKVWFGIDMLHKAAAIFR